MMPGMSFLVNYTFDLPYIFWLEITVQGHCVNVCTRACTEGIR